MTPKARTAALAKIHIGKKQVGMADEAYRAMLVNIGGVRPVPGQEPSAAQLDEAGIARVVAHLKSLGFVPTRPARAGKKPRMTAERQAMMDKIDAYLAEAGRPIKYANSIAKQMFKMDGVAWCDGAQLRKIIASLDKEAEKAGRATG